MPAKIVDLLIIASTTAGSRERLQPFATPLTLLPFR